MLLDDARLFRVNDHPLGHGRPLSGPVQGRLFGVGGASA